MFEMLYERGNGQLWYYDENGIYVESHYSKCGVRQGCVLDAFFFCLVICPVYARLGALLGPDGAMYAYSDDVYLVFDPVNMSIALVVAPTIYQRVGLSVGWEPGKTELILLHPCDPDTFLQQLEAYGEGLPHIVPGFSVCLGVPRHANNDPEFHRFISRMPRSTARPPLGFSGSRGI
jgi:hypothetical protein